MTAGEMMAELQKMPSDVDIYLPTRKGLRIATGVYSNGCDAFLATGERLAGSGFGRVWHELNGHGLAITGNGDR